MKFVFLMDPIESIDQDKDSTFVMMLESQARNHTVLYGQIGDLRMEGERLRGRVFPTQVKRGSPHFELKPASDVYLDEVDAVFMRKDPPFDMNYVFTTYMLDLLAQRTLVVNDPQSILRANEKMYTLNFPELIPKTCVARDMAVLKAFLEELGGQMIIKPWDAAGGHGVLLLSREDRNLNSLLEISTRDGQEYVIAQQYIPEARQGDKRIILVNGEPEGAILRVPSDEDNRGNIHVGAQVQEAELSPRDREICSLLGPRLRQDGLLFVGIDVLGDYLTEINVTSPTGIQELNQFDGIQVESTLLDFVEDFVRQGRTRLSLC